MSIATHLPWWSRSGDPRSRQEIEQDVRAELESHFAQLVDDLESQGTPPAEAQRVARDRFGDIDGYVACCEQIKTGDRIVLQRILLGVSGTLVVLTGVLGWQLWSVAGDQQQLISQIEQTQLELQELRAAQAEPATATPPREKLAEVSGRITDDNGQPIADAHVLAIYKTWPDGRYQQRSANTTTNADGEFQLTKRLDIGHKHALQIAFAAEGYTLASRYSVNPAKGEDRLAPIDVMLQPVTPVRVRVVRSDGTGLASASVLPSSRQSPTGETANVYFQGSAPIHLVTEADGTLTLPYFQPGDQAELTVQVDDKWQNVNFVVSADDQPQVVALP